ncbi:hypothetical protein [Halorussus halobius]|uniref:hypothetical protein n=1 Tax=Halorussus halobius TaxID=1710537 RepID=UPI001092340D|nr:hypothetical protein [Halorussus halobius]
MTLEYRQTRGDGESVVTTACGLCGQSLREGQGMQDHLPACPVREVYAEPRVLREGGPDPDRVRALLDGEGEGVVADD